MARPSETSQREAIIAAVLELIAAGGYDEVQLREVAKRARVSLATIYKLFATRDDLIVAALVEWRATNVYEGLDAAPPDESLADGLMRVFRHIFEPWERAPRMLEAFHRARKDPRGDPFTADGTMVVGPVVQALFEGRDPDYAADVQVVLQYVVYGAVGQFVDGTIEVTDILPLIERAVFRLTGERPQPASRRSTRRVTARR